MKQPLPPELAGYQALVTRYHRTLDLISPTGLRDLPSMIDESLRYASLAPSLRPLRWLDVGSGAGLPAIPLAISQPEIRFTLVERRRRRIAFLQLARTQLELDNVEVIEGDIAAFSDPQGFEVVSAQAVGSLTLLYRLTRHLLAPGATLLARKGPDWQKEVHELEALLFPALPATDVLVLPRHGRLVSVKLPGGPPCPSSA